MSASDNTRTENQNRFKIKSGKKFKFSESITYSIDQSYVQFYRMKIGVFSFWLSVLVLEMFKTFEVFGVFQLLFILRCYERSYITIFISATITTPHLNLFQAINPKLYVDVSDSVISFIHAHASFITRLIKYNLQLQRGFTGAVTLIHGQNPK